MIETLSHIESPAVAQRTGKKMVGHLSFGLNDTMALFARANLVVFIRNAGRAVVKVGGIARALDRMMERRVEPGRMR